MALNPGFPHYLGNWWPTLRRLWHAQVPIVTTGYGHSFGSGFALPALYNLAYAAPGGGLPHQDTAGHLRRPSLQSGAQTTRLPEIQTASAEKKETNLVCAESQGFLGMPVSDATLCSDREAIALVADHAGFSVLFAIRNPFIFCSPPLMYSTSPNCQGNEVLSILQPREGSRHARLALKSERTRHAKTRGKGSEKEGDKEEIPNALAHEIMRRSLTCYSNYQEHHKCMERRLQNLASKKLPRYARAGVDAFLDKLADSCARASY